MKIRIDRNLPVSLGHQLRGQIEYGIACGELGAGQRLPSVRELAAETGLAPVTVLGVYRELQLAGLLEGRPGRGTFVPEAGLGADRTGRLELVRLIDRLVELAEARGVGWAELAAMLAARRGRPASSRALRLVLVGIFTDATRSYAADLRTMLPPGDVLEATTLEELRANPVGLAAARQADLVVSFAHRLAEVRHALGSGAPVVAVQFIPSERTRMALAELPPLTRLGLVSTFPKFLPTLKAGVARHAPHLDGPVVTVVGPIFAPGALASLARGCDAVVYSTGSEAVLAGLPSRVRAVEYRHVPDPRSVERDLLPLLEPARAQPDQVPPPGERAVEEVSP